MSNATNGFAVVPLLRGGPNARIESILVIFKNAQSNYPMQNVPDELENVCYRTGPRGWMRQCIFNDTLHESRFFSPDVSRNGQLIFIDNAPCYNETEQLLETLSRINTSLMHLPPNTTHKVQPLDTGILNIFKVWREIREEDKFELIEDGEWVSGEDFVTSARSIFYDYVTR